MSQWARNNPELYEEGVRYENVYDLDRYRQEIKDGFRCPQCLQASHEEGERCPADEENERHNEREREPPGYGPDGSA